jgi:hypothetical protein
MFVDPVLSIGGALGSGDGGLVGAGEDAVGNSSSPPEMGQSPGNLENTQSGLDGDDDDGGGIGEEPGGPPLQAVYAYIEREHVWGPGDKGPDELLVEFDASANPWWVIQDEGGDVVALCDTGGSGTRTQPGEGGSNPITVTVPNLGRVAAQWTYDAYGAVQSAADLLPHPVMRAGHKGLFCERLDTSVGLTGELTPRLVPYGHILYYVRNRMYMPSLGRWLQQDPYAVGVALVSTAIHSGQSVLATLPLFELAAHFTDGCHTAQYLGSNPWRRSDAMGLFIGDYAINTGITVGMMANELISTYAVNMEDDLDWALDWSRADDAHSRLDASWIAPILNRHVDDAVHAAIWGPLDDLSTLNNIIFGSLRSGEQLAAKTLRTGARFLHYASELHHSLPRYLANAMGLVPRCSFAFPSTFIKSIIVRSTWQSGHLAKALLL